MIELELAPHYEVEADPKAEDYRRLENALGKRPLYHQWHTYEAKDTNIVVNSYNTGTGKTKAALLRLLDLDEAYKRSRYNNANVLFIAPTNELLRQHEQDIKDFIKHNRLSHILLRLDAATIKELGHKHLGGKFVRQGDRLHQMLQDPGSVLTDSDGYHIEGHHPYVLVINPDIFYYALYGLGNPHDQKVLFRAFIKNFGYIVVDEFHYYNAKQLANFLFFLTLLREWGYFDEGRRVCLLTATPVQQVQDYLSNLHLTIEYIRPGNEPPGLPTIPALAPVRLWLYSADTLEDGLISLAASEKGRIQEWLQHERHGAFISSALWRINRLYQEYGGKGNRRLGRLTGAERREWREQNKDADLLMATPTVDIGYNFERRGKKRQNIDFLLFDARSSDEFIQRLGRGGRVLGKDECDIPSDVWAVVPDELVTELGKLVAKKIERSELNRLVNEILPPKNGIYAYINSGAIAEAFLPLYGTKRSLPTEQAVMVEQLYNAVCQVYGAAKPLSFKKLTWNTRRYLEIKSHLPDLLREANAERFEFGQASVIVRTMDEQPDVELNKLEKIDETFAQRVENFLRQKRRARVAELKRQAEIEEYYIANARFNFRDNFQPPLALVHDPEGLLATAEYTIYSALHIAQNYLADWFDSIQQEKEWIEKAGGEPDEQVNLYCELRRPREQRLSIYFKLSSAELTRRDWEAHYCSTLAATHGFRLLSDDGPVPAELNKTFEQSYFTFYAVPAVGPEAHALMRLKRSTSLFTNMLKVDFGGEGEHEYLMVVGSAALLVSCEKSIVNAKFVAKRASARDSHIFDWQEEL